MNFEVITGYLAAVCTTIAFIPQALKIIKHKNTKDISIQMYIIFNIGIVLWLVYGIIRIDYPLIFANSITFIIVFIILIMKIKFK